MLNFWNLPKRLRPKIWPKEGQNFSKSKKFKSLNEDMKDYNHFLQEQTQIYFVRLFVVVFGSKGYPHGSGSKTHPPLATPLSGIFACLLF